MSRLGSRGGLAAILVITLCVSSIAIYAPDVSDRALTYQIERPTEQMHPKLLRLTSLDMRGGVGAVKWLDMLTYFGGMKLRKNNRLATQWIYHSMVSQVLLNPYHLDAYYFTSAVFPTSLHSPEKSARILQYGASYRTADWRIMFSLGYELSTYFDNTDRAMDVWEIGSALPEAPQYLAALTAMHGYKDNTLERNIIFLNQMIVDWQGPQTYYQEMILMRQTFSEMFRLQLAIKSHQERTGFAPNDISDLAEYTTIVPTGRDPQGGVYYYDREQHRVMTTSKGLLPYNLKENRPKLPVEFFQPYYARNLLEELSNGGPKS